MVVYESAHFLAAGAHFRWPGVVSYARNFLLCGRGALDEQTALGHRGGNFCLWCTDLTFISQLPTVFPTARSATDFG